MAAGRHILCCILVFFVTACGTVESDKYCRVDDIPLIEAPLDIMVLSFGQSNSMGVSCEKELFNERSNVFFFYGSGWSNIHNYDRVGPEASLAERLGAEYPSKNIGVIKIAYGGTRIEEWLPGGPIYDEILDTIRSTGYEVSGYFWMQGETDSVLWQDAINYDGRLSYLISALRDDDAPFIVGLIGTRAFPYVDAVRAAQLYVADNTASVYTVETNDLEKNSDAVHFTGPALSVLGERFADKFIEVGGI